MSSSIAAVRTFPRWLGEERITTNGKVVATHLIQENPGKLIGMGVLHKNDSWTVSKAIT
jgi:hypothetical protein